MFSSWRGIIGVVHPTLRPGSNEELIRMLPEGIGVLALHVNIKRGTPDEFKQMKTAFEKELDLLKEAGCDVIHPSGAPPFMVHGRKGEAKIIKDWEKRYGIPMFTSGQNHVNALRAMKAKSIVGATYFPEKTNEIFSQYFKDAGFKVKAMAGVDVPFNKVQELSGEVVYAHIKKAFLSGQGRRCHLHAGFRMAYLAHHRNAGAGSGRSRHSSRSRTRVGIPETPAHQRKESRVSDQLVATMPAMV